MHLESERDEGERKERKMERGRGVKMGENKKEKRGRRKGGGECPLPADFIHKILNPFHTPTSPSPQSTRPAYVFYILGEIF
jgi:hypothetical protein